MLFEPFLRSGVMTLPLAFISTLSRSGIRNIAPYSSIMPVLRPLDLICLASAKKRDTLANIRNNEEFVVNMAGAALADKVMPLACYSSPDSDVFADAGIAEKPSGLICAPGMEGAYAWMECSLHEEYEQHEYVLIIGKVLRLETDDNVLTPEGCLDVQKARPLVTTGAKNGMNFCTVKELNKFESFDAIF
ncbi:MAG: flavin reductase family protein [Desulfosalsimonadaceae bacterium]